MKRLFLLFLPFLLFVAGTFVACEEVEEAGKYDNWRPRNEAFVDSIKGKAGDRLVLTAKMLMKWKRVNYLQYRCRQPVPI